MITLVVTYQWPIFHININNAFLNGQLKEDVYMIQPRGFVDPTKPNHVCRLTKTLYRLKQTFRVWYEKLKKVLVEQRFDNVVSNISLFTLQNEQMKIYVLVYVDDMLLTGIDARLIDELDSELDTQFSLKRLDELSCFLGFEAERTEKGLFFRQSKYASNLLVKSRINETNVVSTPLSMGVKLYVGDSELFKNPTFYKSIAGSLQYLTMTRPGLSF